jgi:hypothetical protein
MENGLLKLFIDTHSVTGNLREQFRKIAESLMLRHALRVNDDVYEFVEIEFYYKNEQTHVDQNTHAKDGQKTCGELYFNGFGVDITFGDMGRGIYGGILLRGLRNTRTGAFTSKPIAVLERIMRSIGSVFSIEKKLGIIPYDCEPVEIVSSPRIRLSKQDVTNELPYRFIKYLIPEHKFDGKEAVVKEWVRSKSEDKSKLLKEALGYSVPSLPD